MAGRHKSRLVPLVQRALSAGPVPQDALLEAVHQAGLRWVEPGHLWETCATHGLADLREDMWVPRGWAPPTADGAVDDEPHRHVPHRHVSEGRKPSSAQTPVEERAAAEVRRIAAPLGLATVEATPPVGPVPAGWPEVAAGAARALRDELKAVTSRRTQTDVPLTAGAEAGKATSRRKLMRFEAQGELGVAEGTQATLIVKDVSFQVEVVSVFSNVVTLSMPPDALAAREATLRLDLSWLLAAQTERLDELAHGGPGFDAVAAMAVVTPERPPVSAARVKLPARELKGLNAGQRNAVALALAPAVTWLWGPPGTGKTTTVSALVAKMCERGNRVLLAAPTNAALDVAITSLLRRMPDLAQGDLVRVGQPADPSLADRPDGHILVDEIAADRGAPLARHRVEVGGRLRELRKTLDALKRRNGQLTTAEETTRLRTETEIAELQAVMHELDRQLRAVRRQICREATVVAATAHQVVLETLKEITFDVVVLDEASMTSAALAMLVAGAGCGHTVIAGDFRQLPPVAVAETPAVHEWLKRSPFEKAGVASAVTEGRPPVRLAALTEQYRMRQRIGYVVSGAFYPESPLSTAKSVANRAVRSRAPWASTQLVVIDTSTMRARTARRQGIFSRYNLMHAQLAAALVGGATSQTQDLAMISPFAPQARLLEALLPEVHLEEWAASTVHRFQGGERDIIVYDTVDTGCGVSPLHPWFTEGDTGSEGARLLNVAASRARDHLVVIGAIDSLFRPRAARDPVWMFFAHLLAQAKRLPWEDPVASEGGVTEHIESGIAERLREDIARAATVDMWLPETPLLGLADLLPALRSVDPDDSESEAVTVWIEPEADGHLPAEALRARREGVNIRPCVPILESCAVVGDIVWSASGSLLGPDPGVVLRTEHRAFADAVRRAQRRRPGGAGSVPGSGQLGDDCGRCRRMLVRYEQDHRGRPDLRYECPHCDRLPQGGRRSRR
ncbi:AAA family ATPase [Microbispora sp. NEAU-D428]|uniref:DEAD/DEAH box helicase n=1 Tax=Microbispora sitophila TaxID=2771537 RepID=UPI001866AE7E|nr:AAA domain-containing protein [Microbispora sitophila]MBE3011914.1 AAA family ATPase [Microbispora sitophila]